MRIFGKKKQEEIKELELRRTDGKHSYDMFAALAKALLLFLLVYGAIGGFLSAYEISYNKGVCMLLIFLFSLILSMVYETEKRWLINLVSVMALFLYFYIAFANFWVINSGYYNIINTVLEAAREYLGVISGTEYELVVEEEYTAVTVFSLFLGMVGCIIFNIELQNKASLFKIVLFTFTPYLIPLYCERSPEILYIMLLFAGYAMTAVLHGGNVREHRSMQARYMLPVVVVCAAMLIRLPAFLFPQDIYRGIVPENASKASTKDEAEVIAQFGMMSLFPGSITGGGISGGRLSNGSAVIADYETDLIVRYTPYSFHPVYLKAFTGRDYEKTQWTEETGESLNGYLDEEMIARMDAYESDPERYAEAVMTIENVDADEKYYYMPYYTEEVASGKWRDKYREQLGEIADRDNVTIYEYYPSVGTVSVPIEDVDRAYLTVPDSCRAAVQQVCEEAGFSGTPEEIVDQVVKFFDENYSYTLRPGYAWGNPDYITHFLLNNKKGYCAHFASAGTMLLRYLGIPARYVEGYAFSYYEVVENGILVEDAEYEDYYRGYSPIGDTALIELEIPDANAHAWVEAYLPGRGWTVVDPTPSSTEVNTTSFWDAFLTNNGSAEDPMELGQSNIGSYLERAIGGASYLLLFGGTAAILFVMAGYVRRLRREQALPVREQVRLEYRRLKADVEGRDPSFATYRTLKEQLNFVRDRYHAEITDDQEQMLYRVFFGEDVRDDTQRLNMEHLKKRLMQVRRKIRNVLRRY